MKKKLYRSMCTVACGTILLTAVVSLLIFYGLIETQIKETIRNECYLVAAVKRYGRRKGLFLTSLQSRFQRRGGFL